MAPRWRWSRAGSTGSPRCATRSRRKGGRAVAIEADVTDRAPMMRAFDAAEAALGTVTILVNNAGVAHAPVRATDVAPEEWRSVLVDRSRRRVLLGAGGRAKRMLAANKKGAIVNIASVLGLSVAKGAAAYATAKAGGGADDQGARGRARLQGRARQRHRAGLVRHRDQRRLSESEAGDKIKRDIPMGRFGNAGDLDGALLLLVSDAGAYMAGATIVVDGGQVVSIKG